MILVNKRPLWTAANGRPPCKRGAMMALSSSYRGVRPIIMMSSAHTFLTNDPPQSRERQHIHRGRSVELH